MTEPQDETIRFLSRAGSFGVTGEVERIDTHAAIVFLAGERAYKLKRAIRFPYLDYSTLEARRIACDAELRLNRRTAPDLYLEVAPVCRDASGALNLAGRGVPVDWLVVMRRFAQNALFTALAERHDLTPALLRSLADHIAVFHRDAEPLPGQGGSESLRAVLEGNRTSLERFPELFAPAQVDALQRASEAELEAHAAQLDARAAAGKVRRCHGDLHLRNICLIDGMPTLFDCIEFSDTLACIDVLYDLAFLLMDLWERKLPQAANFVFNRYIDVGDEADGIGALPLFMSARAAVRAHVCAAAAKAQREPDQKAAQEEAARRYFDTAFAVLRPRPARLIAIGGVSGTGKSTLAYGLAPGLGRPPGARVIRSDVIRKRVAGLVPEVRLSGEGYSPAVTEQVYAQLTGDAAAALNQGMAVIVDAVFMSPAKRSRVQRIARLGKVEFDGIWLEAARNVLTARLERRTADASDATPTVLSRQLKQKPGPLGHWRRIEAGGEAAGTMRAAIAALDARSNEPHVSGPGKPDATKEGCVCRVPGPAG